MTAIIALLAALALGIVKPKDAFSGFSDDIVIIVGSALVMSAAVQRSGVIEIALAFVSKRVKRVRSRLSRVDRVGRHRLGAGQECRRALAMLMPAAFSMAKKNNTSPRCS